MKCLEQNLSSKFAKTVCFSEATQDSAEEGGYNDNSSTFIIVVSVVVCIVVIAGIAAADFFVLKKRNDSNTDSELTENIIIKVLFCFFLVGKECIKKICLLNQ